VHSDDDKGASPCDRPLLGHGIGDLKRKWPHHVAPTGPPSRPKAAEPLFRRMLTEQYGEEGPSMPQHSNGASHRVPGSAPTSGLQHGRFSTGLATHDRWRGAANSLSPRVVRPPLVSARRADSSYPAQLSPVPSGSRHSLSRLATRPWRSFGSGSSGRTCPFLFVMFVRRGITGSFGAFCPEAVAEMGEILDAASEKTPRQRRT
jgi:hypothetical protein